MPVRGQVREVIGNGRGLDTLTEDDKSNLYEWNGSPTGAADARSSLWNQGLAAGGRAGPQMDNAQASADFARALAGRGDQQYLQGYLGNMAAGTSASPAQIQLMQQTVAAQNAQRSMAASGRGFGAMAGAPRDAQLASQNIGMAGAQQLGVQRAQDMAMGRDQYGALSEAMRQQDLQGRGLQQEDAYRQAQLSDDQRTRNDAMARFYLGQRTQIGQDQLNANIGYERGDAARAAGSADLDWADQQRRDAQNQQYTAAAIKGGADASAIASTMEDKSNGDDRRRRGY